MKKTDAWELRAIPADYWEKHPESWCANGNDVTLKYFARLSDAFDYIGCKLHRERCGYSGIVGNIEYTITRC